MRHRISLSVPLAYSYSKTFSGGLSGKVSNFLNASINISFSCGVPTVISNNFRTRALYSCCEQ